MARPKKIIETPVETTETAPVSETSDSVTVSWRGQTRTFSRDIHGDDFKSLAKDFAKKFDGALV